MSDTDSFIDEVSEEVRKDRLYKAFRRYGWIAVLAVLVLVGGASYNEWRKAQIRNQAQSLGDQILTALNQDERRDRAAALAEIETPEGGARAIIGLLSAGEAGTVAPQDAAAQFFALADDPSVPSVYRQIAVLKAVALPGSEISVDERRARLEDLVPGGGLVRLLAQEQLALIDLELGDMDAAQMRLTEIFESAEATPGLRQRSAQLIVAMGGDLETALASDDTQSETQDSE